MTKYQTVNRVYVVLGFVVIIAVGAMTYSMNSDEQVSSSMPISSMKTNTGDSCGHDHTQPGQDHDIATPTQSLDTHTCSGSHDHGEENDHASGIENADSDNNEHSASDGHNHSGDSAHSDTVSISPDRMDYHGIQTEAVHKQDLKMGTTVPGRISFNLEKMAHIGSPVDGRTAEILVKLGDWVKLGDPLLLIDSPAFGETQSDFLQGMAQVAIARSNLDVTRSSLDRAKRLLDAKGISLSEYQRRDMEHTTAEGTLRAAESVLIATENKLHLFGFEQTDIDRLIQTSEVNRRLVIHAPIEGCVIRRDVTLGQMVGSDQESLLTLADTRTLWVLADVPELQIPYLSIGSTTAIVSVDALGDESYQGRISYIAPSLNPETRTVQIRVEIEDGNRPIKPGMFASIELLFHGENEAVMDNALVIPDSAIQQYENKPTVFVAHHDQPGIFSARPVVPGQTDGSRVAIVSGLQEGEQVVVDGAFIIKAELAKGMMEGKTCSGH